MEGQLPQDILMQGTNKDTVDFEMDIYWVVTAGADPIAWFNKYPGRWKLCHVKDRRKGAEAKDHDASVDRGTGSIDFKKILKAGKSKGLEYFIVEQERYDNSTPLKSAETDAAYMKKFKF
jgi:sugar phosphate isomerase/epimerase